MSVVQAMSNLPWFRFYVEAVDDEKLRLLAFEDRWHFVALLCCKGNGILDADQTDELMRRKVALKLGLSVRELDEVSRRLSEVGLLDNDTLQPISWDERQMRSDSSAERVRAFREKKKTQQKQGNSKLKRDCNVTVTAQDKDTDTDTDTDKNIICAFSEDFEGWWKDEYPKRKGTQGSKPQSKAIYIRNRKAGVTKEQISKATQEYFDELWEADRVGTEFVKQTTTWLNGKFWEND